jgi:hypothetical protein
MCQELLLRVIYQSRQSHAKNSLFGRRCALHRHFSAGNTVSIHETSPFGCANALSGQWPGVPPAYSRAPPGIQISPKEAKSLSLKSQLFGAMLYPSGSKKSRPIIFVSAYADAYYQLYCQTVQTPSLSLPYRQLSLSHLNYQVIKHHLGCQYHTHFVNTKALRGINPLRVGLRPPRQGLGPPERTHQHFDIGETISSKYIYIFPK